MKTRWWEPLGLLIIVTAMAVVLGTRAPEAAQTYSSGNLLRLRVVAASDSDVDQELKFRVRDAVTEFLAPLLGAVETIDDARDMVQSRVPELEEVVTQTLLSEGFEYPVSLQISKDPFPSRTYGRVIVPAGDYEALRITIGDGEGTNWWCVLFPPLCFLEVSGTPGTLDRDAAVAVLARDTSDGYELADGEIRLTLWTAKAVSGLAREVSGVWRQVNGVFAGR